MFKTIIKLLVSIILLITAGYLFYNNFINDKKQTYAPPKTFEVEQMYTKFDLDVLEDKVFKELKQAKQIGALISNTTDKGRVNPFVSF